MDNKTQDNTDSFSPLARLFLWADNPNSVSKLVYGLYALCAVLFLVDFAYHKHVYLEVEEIPGFYALYGFIMCTLLVISAKGMRVFLKRDEDYYAPHDVESEEHPEDQLEKVNHDG